MRKEGVGGEAGVETVGEAGREEGDEAGPYDTKMV